MLSIANHWKYPERYSDSMVQTSLSVQPCPFHLMTCYSYVCVQLGKANKPGSQNILQHSWNGQVSLVSLPLHCTLSICQGIFEILAGLSTLFHTFISLIDKTIQLYHPLYLVTLYLSLCRHQSCLLTPFKGVNAEIIGLYAITFDAVLYSSIITLFSQV